MNTLQENDLKSTLLIVDDDVAFLKALTRSMSRLEYLVWPVPTCAQARAAIEVIKPDFAVVDLRLDDGSGIDVVKYIKKKSPHTRSVLLSGYANESSAVSAVIAGATDCVAKPVHAEELHADLISARTDRIHLPDRFMHPEEARIQHILSRWAKNNMNTTHAANELGLHRRSLQRMLARIGVDSTKSEVAKNSQVVKRYPGLSRFWTEILLEQKKRGGTIGQDASNS